MVCRIAAHGQNSSVRKSILPSPIASSALCANPSWSSSSEAKGGPSRWELGIPCLFVLHCILNHSAHAGAGVKILPPAACDQHLVGCPHEC